VHRLLTKSLAADLAVGVVVSALLVIGAAPAAHAASGGWLDPTLVRLAALVALVQTADGTTGAALLVAGRPDARAWAMAVASAVRVPVVGGAALAFGTPRWVLVASLVAGVLGSAVQAWLAWRLGWRQWRKGERRPEAEVSMAQLLSFGLRSAAATTVSGARNGLIPIILGRLAGAETVGFFEVATFPVRAANVAGAPVRLALFPEQARLWSEKNSDELRRSVHAYVRAGLLIGIPAAAVGWLLLPWLIGALYSPGYAAAAEPARILLLAAVLGLAFGWSKTLPAAVGRPGIRVAVLGLDALTVIPLLVLLGSRGAQGAAIAITAGLFVQALAWALLLPRVVPAG
jgi:O-antigen/teichoic acid export membrane protein